MRRRPYPRLAPRRHPTPTVLVVPLGIPTPAPQGGGEGDDRDRILRAAVRAFAHGPEGRPMDEAWLQRNANALADDLLGIRLAPPPPSPRAPDPDWEMRAIEALERVASRLARFTADDVWEELGGGTGSTRLGHVLKRGERSGLCAPSTDFASSSRKDKGGRKVRVWTSLLHTEETSGAEPGVTS